MKKFALLGLAGTTVASALMATPAQAFSFFTDRTAWESALSGAGLTLVNEDFESFSDEFSADPFLIPDDQNPQVTIKCIGDALACEDPLLGKEIVADSPTDPELPTSGINGLSDTVLGIGLIDIPDTTSSELMTLPTHNQAFGVNFAKLASLDFGAFATGNVNFTINGASESFELPSGLGNEEFFFGVIAGAGEVVEEITIGGYTGTVFYDNLAYAVKAEEPEAVPEPASMLGLLTVGAVAAGGALKRKQAQA